MIPAISHRIAARLPFFYGYVMIPVAMLVQVATSPGQTFAISAFTPYLRDGLSLSDSQLSLAYMLGTLFAAVPLSLIGPLSDRFGLRGITLAAVMALSCACYFASQVTNFATLLIAFFLLRFLGQGSLSLLSGNAISMWFRSRIGRVTAAMSIGTAIAFAWIPAWINDSIREIGWRSTYQWIAVIVAVTMVPLVVLLFCNRPEDVGQQVDGRNDETNHEKTSAFEHSLTMREAARSRAFYILAGINTLWAMAGTGVVFYLFTLCEDLGFPSSVPANLFKSFGLAMLAAQLLGGVVADFWPLNRLLTLGVLMLSGGLALICWGESELALHGFAALFGGGQGLLLAVGSVLWVRYYGRVHLGAIRGAVWCCTVAGSGCGPLLMGIARDRTGGFDIALYAFFGVMTVMTLLAWWANPPATTERARTT